MVRCERKGAALCPLKAYRCSATRHSFKRISRRIRRPLAAELGCRTALSQRRVDANGYFARLWPVVSGHHHIDQPEGRQLACCAGEVMTTYEGTDADALERVLDQIRVDDVFRLIGD